MKYYILFALLVFGLTSSAQISKASLQASGLTCSMCSKAVKEALEEVSFVEKVMVDIKSQRYNLTFKSDAKVDIDALGKAVEDAGFSVAQLKVTLPVTDLEVKKDEHVKIGENYFHFLNADGKRLNGDATFTLVDKQYLSEKDFKKYSSSSKMECVKTGFSENCCKQDNIAEHTRIYHVII